MTKDEFATFARAMKTYYSKESSLLPNKQAMSLWYEEIKDIQYPVAQIALRMWVSTNKWSPTIAELREACTKVRHGDDIDWSDSWQQVTLAMRKYGYYNGGQALASLDPVSREIVKRIGWGNLCMSTNPVNDQLTYKRYFEVYSNREKLKKQLAIPLQREIIKLQIDYTDDDYMALGGGEDESQTE